VSREANCSSHRREGEEGEEVEEEDTRREGEGEETSGGAPLPPLGVLLTMERGHEEPSLLF